jgi:hypothetical protein
MESKKVIAVGVIGTEVQLSTQELIVLADLVSTLKQDMSEYQEKKNSTKVHVDINTVNSVVNFIGKLTGEVKGLQETEEDLFSPIGVVEDTANNYL